MPPSDILNGMEAKAGAAFTGIMKRICKGACIHDPVLKQKNQPNHPGNVGAILPLPNLFRPLFQWACESSCQIIQAEAAIKAEPRPAALEPKVTTASAVDTFVPATTTASSVSETGYEVDATSSFTSPLPSATYSSPPGSHPTIGSGATSDLKHTPGANGTITVHSGVFVGLVSLVVILCCFLGFYLVRINELRELIETRDLELATRVPVMDEQIETIRNHENTIMEHENTIADQKANSNTIVRNLYDEKQGLTTQLEAANEAGITQKKELDEANEKVDKLKKAADKTARLHSEEKQRLEKAEKNTADKLEKAEKKATKSEETSKELRTNLNQAKAHWKQQETAHGEEISGLQNEKQDLVTQIRNTKLTAESEKSAHAQEMKASAAKLSTLEGACAQKDQELATLSKDSADERKKLQQTITGLKRAIETKDIQHDQQLTQITETATKAVHDKQRLEKQVQDGRKERSKLEEAHQRFVQQIIEDRETQLDAIKAMLLPSGVDAQASSESEQDVVAACSDLLMDYSNLEMAAGRLEELLRHCTCEAGADFRDGGDDGGYDDDGHDDADDADEQGRDIDQRSATNGADVDGAVGSKDGRATESEDTKGSDTTESSSVTTDSRPTTAKKIRTKTFERDAIWALANPVQALSVSREQVAEQYGAGHQKLTRQVRKEEALVKAFGESLSTLKTWSEADFDRARNARVGENV